MNLLQLGGPEKMFRCFETVCTASTKATFDMVDSEPCHSSISKSGARLLKRYIQVA